jgi:hypothetical protein
MNNYQRWGQLGHPHWEDDTTCNYAHDVSMFDHLGLPTITHKKIKPYALAN